MLDKEMNPGNTHGSSIEDMKFLGELNLTDGDIVPDYHFICVPETPFTDDRIPTGLDIIRELKNFEKFKGNQSEEQLQESKLPFPNSSSSTMIMGMLALWTVYELLSVLK